MRRIVCQSLFGAGLAVLLTAAPATLVPAQDTASPTDKATARPIKPAQASMHVEAAKPIKRPVKAARKTPEHPGEHPGHKHPGHKVAAHAAKPKPSERHAASAPKKPAAPDKAKPNKTKTVSARKKTRTASHATATHGNVVKRAAAPARDAPRAPAAVASLPALPPKEAGQPPPEAPVSAAAAARPHEARQAAAFVAAFLGEAFRIARSRGTNGLQRRAQLADLFAAKMDVSRIATSTTANELAATSSDIQRRFRTILVSYLVETYYPRIELASDAAVKVETTGATPLPDGTAVVWTSFSKAGWGTQSVKWHLIPSADGFKIVDIFSAGASLVQMERDTFVSVMRDGGLIELMAKLDARTRALANEAP